MEDTSVFTDYTYTCRFFGAITPERREKRRKCKICMDEHQKVFSDCIKVMNEILGTEILIIGGEEITNKLNIKDRGNEMNENINDVNVTSGDSCGVDKKVVKIDGESFTVPKHGKGSRAHVKETKGVFDLAKKLVRDGKSDQEALVELINAYTSAGKNPKQAKHNAQSILFHAKKRVAGGTNNG